MAYREEWVDKILGGRSVLSVALDVHMTKTGSLDGCEDTLEDDLKALRHIEENWKPTVHEDWQRFDNAVREVIRACIEEPNWMEGE